MTTIKVDTAVRDRLNAIARSENTTVSKALEQLIAARERAERFRQLREDMASMGASQREEYLRELSDWDSTLSDGLAAGAR